jgi:hypothetical protein
LCVVVHREHLAEVDKAAGDAALVHALVGELADPHVCALSGVSMTALQQGAVAKRDIAAMRLLCEVERASLRSQGWGAVDQTSRCANSIEFPRLPSSQPEKARGDRVELEDAVRLVHCRG